jgi:hypothetical protein
MCSLATVVITTGGDGANERTTSPRETPSRSEKRGFGVEPVVGDDQVAEDVPGGRPK